MANTNLHSFSTRQKSFQMGLNSMLLLFIYSCIVFRLSHTLCIASCPFVHLHLLFPGLSFFSCLICSSICFCLIRFFLHSALFFSRFLFSSLFTLSVFVSFALIYVFVYEYENVWCFTRSLSSPFSSISYTCSILLSKEIESNIKNGVEKRLPGFIDCDTCSAVAWLGFCCCRDMRLAIAFAIVDITASDVRE